MTMFRCRCLNCITPPHLLKQLLENSDSRVREAAQRTMLTTARLRGERTVSGFIAGAAPPSHARRTVFDCRHGTRLSSAIVARTEDGPKSKDDAANRAFEGLGATRDFYREIFNRDSINGRGMRLNGYVHYSAAFNNAFWDGREMVFGDGDGVLFTDFTKSLDVIAHELTHGVTEFSAGLEYHKQSGALNESISDVFGSLVKQWARDETADKADWLIGAEVFTPKVGLDALRSMKAPGTAYDRDPQPDHMDNYADMPDTEEGDNGGVHINSGIPNKAFYLTAIGIGGFAWEAPGHVWYAALQASSPKTNFQDFADTTSMKAEQLFGTGSREQQAVVSAWREVGVRVSRARPVAAVAERPRRLAMASHNGHDDDVDLEKQIAKLAAEVAMLSKEIGTMKGKGRQ
jgi:Zn-dependent metalloprotease